MDAGELGRWLAAGEWVVDVRDRRAYAAEHLYGGVGVELGQLARVRGLLPDGAPFVLAGDSPDDMRCAVEELAGVGLAPAGTVVGPVGTLAGPTGLARYERATFRDLVRLPYERREEDLLGWDDEPFLPALVIDVRDAAEHAAGHLPEAVHVPLPELPQVLPGSSRGSFPPPTAQLRLWIHCSDGVRASVAAGLLERSGYEITCLDDDLAVAAERGVVQLASS